MTKHMEANIEPVNYQLCRQAHQIYEKVTAMNNQQFSDILDNHETHKDHEWFRKINQYRTMAHLIKNTIKDT